MTPAYPQPLAPPFSVWRYAGRLAPTAVLLLIAVGLLFGLLYSRANWTQQSDEADIREWLSETRVFRKALPELVEEYVELATNPAGPDSERLRIKYDEIEAHLAALTEPTRMYSGKLPLFPEVFSIAVQLPDRPPPPGRRHHPAWVSPVPRPGADTEGRTHAVDVPTGRAVVRCEYRIHTNHQFEQEQSERRYWQYLGITVLLVAGGVALYLAYLSFRRERQRALTQAEAARAAEHREKELLETRLKQKEAEQEAERAARAAEEMKSQLYASIGIMAGSYAHNIKNLLVRPNDLLARCIEVDGLSGEQEGMLREVKTTLGTVTERLHQILRTVRRDPSRAEMTRLDLAELVREAHRTWADMAREKWKVRITAELPDGPLPINGDLSHLQQAVENLVFNARDATFEMRNHLREEARRDAGLDPAARRQKLIEAAAWKGEVALRARWEGDSAVLEVQDNGIGMSEEVRRDCLKTHFTTKRDNALYEGYSAGMGLGLSFVAVVLEHHGAALEIESAPLRGALFRVRFPLADATKRNADDADKTADQRG